MVRRVVVPAGQLLDYEEPPELPEPTREAIGVAALAERYREQHAAREMVQAEIAAAGWAPPWVGQPSLLSDQFAAPRPTEKWLVDRLMGWNHNIVLAAQHGSGKTTLGLNLARSLVDGRAFLGREVAAFDGRVGWVNGEMDAWDLADYARPLRIRNPARIAKVDLRDARLPLVNDYVAEQFAKWCREHDVSVLVMDSWRRLCSWSGLDENVNADVERLTTRIDEFKREAGVSACLILAHTGRAKAEEGEERVRGATALDDWVDGRWVMVRQAPAEGGQRFMFADKRGVEMEETALTFDPLTYRITLGEGNRRTAGNETLKLSAAMLLSGSDGPMNTTQIATELGLGKKTGGLSKVLAELVADGSVRMEEGPRKAKIYSRIG